MAASDSKQIVDKILNGQVKVVEGKKILPTGKKAFPVPHDIVEKVKVENAKVPQEPAPKADAKAEQTAKINANAKVEQPKAPKAVKVEQPKAPVEPKVAAYPFSAKINKYGFLGLGKSELRALGLSDLVVAAEGVKAKLSADIPISVTAFNPETKILTVKIL